MTYENLVKEAKKAVKTVDVKTIKEHLAVEFDIEGKAEGAFYVEFSSTKVEVEPYEYYDHDFRVRTDADSALAILKGELDPVKAAGEGKLMVEGNAAKLETLKKHLAAEAPAKKAPAKKTAAKTTATKTTAKATTTKTAAKTTTTKAAATKTTAKTTAAKTEAKAETKAPAKAAEKKPVPKKVEKKPTTVKK